MAKPIRWFTNPASRTLSGRISLGNRVLVTRFAFSRIIVLDRCSVSWKNNQGRMLQKRNRGKLVVPVSGRGRSPKITEKTYQV